MVQVSKQRSKDLGPRSNSPLQSSDMGRSCIPSSRLCFYCFAPWPSSLWRRVMSQTGHFLRMVSPATVTLRSCTSAHLTVHIFLWRKGGSNETVLTISNLFGSWDPMKMTLSICDCLPLTSGQGRSQDKHDSSRFTAMSHRSWQCFPDTRRAGLLDVPRSNVLVVFTRFPTLHREARRPRQKKRSVRRCVLPHWSVYPVVMITNSFRDSPEFWRIWSDQRWHVSVLAIFTLCRKDGYHLIDFWSWVVRHTAFFLEIVGCAVERFFEYVWLFFNLVSKVLRCWFQWFFIWTIVIFRCAEYVNWFIQLLNVIPYLSDCSICHDYEYILRFTWILEKEKRSVEYACLL